MQNTIPHSDSPSPHCLPRYLSHLCVYCLSLCCDVIVPTGPDRVVLDWPVQRVSSIRMWCVECQWLLQQSGRTSLDWVWSMERWNGNMGIRPEVEWKHGNWPAHLPMVHISWGWFVRCPMEPGNRHRTRPTTATHASAATSVEHQYQKLLQHFYEQKCVCISSGMQTSSRSHLKQPHTSYLPNSWNTIYNAPLHLCEVYTH